MECEKDQREEKDFSLDVIQRGCLKMSLEYLPAWRFCLQMFSFWLELSEAFVSFLNYTNYRQHIRGLQATLLVLLITII